MKKKRSLYLLAAFSVLLSMVTFYGYQIYFTPNLLVPSQDNMVPEDGVLFAIEPGMEFGEVAMLLRKEGILDEPVSFGFLARLMGVRDNFKPGLYRIWPNSTNPQVLRLFRSGNQEPLRLTFTSSKFRTREQMPALLCRTIRADTAEVLSMLNDSTYLASIGFDTTSVIGLFIPNTYEVYWTMDAQGLMARMKFEYDAFWTAERKAKAKALGRTQQEISTIASLIEGETNYNPEKARIAGVIYNRLERGMLLQIDPTLKFAAGDFGATRVKGKRLLDVDSPYNTYKYAGLPPGPINAPSIPSLEAALNPEKNSHLYYCASVENLGQHAFSKSLREHNLYAAAYHRYLNKLEREKAAQ